MKKLLVFLLAVSVCNASEWNSFKHYPDLNVLYHPVSTQSKEAQEAFDRGLLSIYAFNYDEAAKCFDKAAQLDKSLAMACWGLALALDQNLTQFVTPIHAALTAKIMGNARETSQFATPREKAYINALSKRFSDDPKADKFKLRKAYSEEMKKLSEEYPDDLDAAVLYAESIMDVLLWNLWENGKPKEGTEEIIRILESVLKRNPYHQGANHYYIHAIEESPQPEKGLMSACILDDQKLNEWGHLLHTTSHIYLRVGNYEQAVEANKKAVEADKKYIKKHGIEGRYPLKFFSHDLHFLTMAYLWQDRYKKALETANELADLSLKHLSDVTFMDQYLLMPMKVYLYFHRWDKIRKIPEPPASQKIAKPFWAFAQAMAITATESLDKALVAQTKFLSEKRTFFEEAKESASDKEILNFAEELLEAEILSKKDPLEGLEMLQVLVNKQRKMDYLTWYYPVSQTLGARLLQMGRAEEAEAVFRESLQRLPLNGRSLFGLSEALKAQKKFHYDVKREAIQALKYSKEKLTLKDL